MNDSPHPVHQVMEAYRRMAAEARYRPAAPSDGLGNLTAPLDELDVEAEAFHYATRWWATEDRDDGAEFWIGFCDYETRPATIFTVEAARSMCGAADDVARRLLRMALADLTTRPRGRAPRS